MQFNAVLTNRSKFFGESSSAIVLLEVFSILVFLQIDCCSALFAAFHAAGICHVWQSARTRYSFASQGAKPMRMRATGKSIFSMLFDRILLQFTIFYTMNNFWQFSLAVE